MREFMNAARALADPTRVRVLLVLRAGELCACQLTELFGLAPSTMSKHFQILKQAGLVAARKEGRWIHFALAGREAPPAARRALAWVRASLAGGPQARQDARNLQRVLRLDPAELCRRQCRS